MSKEVHAPIGAESLKRMLTIREFCERYGRSRSRTYELIASHQLAAVKDGRSTLIPVDAAEQWAKSLKSAN